MKKVIWFIRNLIFFFLLFSVGSVLAYRFVPVWITPLMVIRATESVSRGEKPVIRHHWVSLKDISPWLPKAVVASEDNRFLTHSGFDFREIEKAIRENKIRKRPRGASTISQQTAKNVFLWPGHSFIRKGLEAYFTLLIEVCWSKKRIMEVYLNSIETGKDIYGAEAVAKYHFHTTAAQLTKSQCALIAATLPNPVRYNSARPSPYILKRQGQILLLMDKIGPVEF